MEAVKAIISTPLQCGGSLSCPQSHRCTLTCERRNVRLTARHPCPQHGVRQGPAQPGYETFIRCLGRRCGFLECLGAESGQERALTFGVGMAVLSLASRGRPAGQKCVAVCSRKARASRSLENLGNNSDSLLSTMGIGVF